MTPVMVIPDHSGTTTRFFVPMQPHTDIISVWIRPSPMMYKAFDKRHRLKPQRSMCANRSMIRCRDSCVNTLN